MSVCPSYSQHCARVFNVTNPNSIIIIFETMCVLINLSDSVDLRNLPALNDFYKIKYNTTTLSQIRE